MIANLLGRVLRREPRGDDGLTDAERAGYAAQYQAVIDVPISDATVAKFEHFQERARRGQVPVFIIPRREGQEPGEGS